MGQEKSKPSYDSVCHEDGSPSGERALKKTSIEEIPVEKDSRSKKSSSSHGREQIPLLDLNFSSKRSSLSSSSSSMSGDCLRDDSYRHILDPLYEKTVGYYHARAAEGDAFGAYYVGLAYENGFGLYEKDTKEACYWYEKSSQRGFILAEHAHQRLSNGSEGAAGGKNNVSVEARAGLLLKAALQGHKQAVVRLRSLCDKEKSALSFLKRKQTQMERKIATETDETSISESLGMLAFLTIFLEASRDSYDDVIELFKQASELGNYDSSYAIGKLYLNGVGKVLPPNEPLAIKYLTVAADHDHLMAQIELGKRFLARSEGHVGNEKFEEKAYRYFKQAADNGSAEGWLNLAHQYLHGEVIENDVNQAIQCLGRAAVTVDYTDSGRSNSRALCVLGRIYRYGLSEIPRDFEKAVGYFTESANRNFPNARLELGKMYARGQGVEQDVSRGRTLLESVHMYAESQYQLARLHEQLNDSKNADYCYKQSMKRYSRDVAKHHDYTIGLYRIAKMYEHGRGTPKDDMKAKAFYYRATTSAEKTYILWWKGYGEKAFRRLSSLPVVGKKESKTNGNA